MYPTDAPQRTPLPPNEREQSSLPYGTADDDLPNDPPFSDDAYGQNQAFQAADQRLYWGGANVDAFDDEASNSNAGRPEPSIDGASIVTAEVEKPEGLKSVSATLDVFHLERYATMNVFVLCASAFLFFAGLGMLTAFKNEWITWMFIVVSLFTASSLLCFTRELRVEFDHDSKTAHIATRRMIVHACGARVEDTVAFSQLGAVAFDGRPGVPGNLCLQFGTKRIVLMANVRTQRHSQVADLVAPWNAFLDWIRPTATPQGVNR
mmetsp:Transcript_37482/g.115755  ORF Transcript_37482/g.115755 Transcript_37482/m.115755 type:complete len:264 (-) Transcript_37482:225-1016(-)